MRRIAGGVGLFVLWSVPGLLSAAATLLLFPKSPTIGGDVRRFLLVSMAPWWIWVALTPPIIWVARRLAADERRLRTLATHVATGIAAALLYVLAAAVASWLMIK